MTKSLVPISKLGTPFQSPSWRYQALNFPEKFGFEWACSKQDVIDAGYLTRLISKGLVPAGTYSLPVYLKELVRELPSHLSDILIKTWDKHYFSSHRRKVSFRSGTIAPISWNIKEVNKLNDDFLKKMILHSFNYKFDPYIEEAVRFYKDPANELCLRWFNYAIYGGIKDSEMAKRWKKSLGFVKAVRLMFFDYSHWPHDKLVQYSLIRQLVNSGEITPADFHMFRRIYDLGELGLRSVLGTHQLTEQEKREVELYMGDTALDNILNLNFTITNSKEALNYNKAISEYANIGLKRVESEQRAALLRLTATKMSKEMGVSEDNKVFEQDVALIKELRELTLFNHSPKFPSFIDIKKDEDKIKVENTT